MLSSTPSAPLVDRTRRAAAATAVALTAFALYHATLLPGVDFGDSASLQTIVGSPFPTPRDAYPLYFAIGGAWLRLSGDEPAHALNLVSAAEAAVACGLLVIVAAEIAGALLPAVAAAALFMVSYTFWSQSVTAEVYALHIALTLASLAALFHWERRQTLGRLALFFVCYAMAFGNHLSMVLLLPGLTVYLLLSSSAGWRSLVTWRVIALAAAIAAAGAAQYLWNIRALWFFPDPPATALDALGTFWVDVTKADWRETLVLNVPQSMLHDRLSMYWFDLRQQFGITGVAVAAVGISALAIMRWRRALLLLLLFGANFAFAFSYNVGDTHVFYLPSHLLVALSAGAGVAAFGRLPSRISRFAGPLAAVAVLAYAGLRGYDDFPAMDRSADRRSAAVLEAMTRDADDQRAILLADLNWQVANGLSYYSKSVRPDVAVTGLRDVLPHAPALVRDNLEIGRATYVIDQAAPVERLSAIAGTLGPGTRYVLCILKPTRELTLDRDDIVRAARMLGGAAVNVPTDDYAVVAGVAGAAPTLVAASNLPFARSVQLGGVSTTIRMESWLGMDTIRRMGFGHVIAGRHHTLIVERGVSFVALDADGAATATLYLGGIFARPRREAMKP